jgi:hypothetical protein
MTEENQQENTEATPEKIQAPENQKNESTNRRVCKYYILTDYISCDSKKEVEDYLTKNKQILEQCTVIKGLELAKSEQMIVKIV